MNQLYTYGQEQNVLVKIGNCDVLVPEVGDYAGMKIQGGLFIEIVPPASIQKDKESWKRLNYFNVFVVANNDLALNKHVMSVGESMVLTTQMPSETLRLLQDELWRDLNPEAVKELAQLPFRSTLPLIALLKDPTVFPKQIKAYAAHEDVRFNVIGKECLKLLHAARELDGVPQRWLEDYVRLLMETPVYEDEAKANEVQAFIDNYVEPEEDEYR